ncbi:MAG TPA: hypothetical protein VJZ69_01070, partial [Clostridia bacterium]|nr:hypothetical protein [Clostridia bacterium]
MKKKFSLILVLLLLVTLVIAMVACNTTPPTPITVEIDETPKATNSVAKAYAWERIYDGMKAVGAPDSTFINFDTAFYFTYQRNGVGSIFYLRAKGSIDIYDDTKSKLSIEIGEDKDGAGTASVEDLLFGIYYTYSNELGGGLLYADMTALAGGKKVMKVTDLSLSQFANVLSKTMSKLNLSTTIEDLLNKELLGNSIVTWISSVLFGECQIFDNGNGQETVNVTLDITDLLGIALGAADSFLAGYSDVLIAVRDATGIDLTDLRALIPAATGSFSVVLQNNVFKSMDFGLDIYYPDIKNPNEIVSIDLGVGKLEIGVVPDVEFPTIPEENLVPFSFTTLSLDVQAFVTTTKTSITISGIEDAFGTLLTSLLASVSNTALANMPINFNTATYAIDLKLRAELDLTNNDNTNILCELYGGEAKTLRAGIYYIGIDDTLYVDLSGILGEGARYKIDELDIVDLIWTSLNNLIDGIGAEASGTAAMTPAQKVATFLASYTETDIENLNAYVENLITSGQVTQQVQLSGTGEASTAAVDLASLITSVLSSIKITKGEGLLSIDRITMMLSKDVLTTIIGMFSDGAELPIEFINVEYESEGFLLGKTLSLDVDFDGILEGFSAHLAVGITYGSLGNAEDEASMRSTLAGVSRVKNTYLDFAEGG